MKRLATICPLLLPFVLAAPTYAQEEMPDTTSAERYFPLEGGNVWEYEGENTLFGTREDQRRAVTGDTLVGDVRYFRYEQQLVDSTGAPAGPLRVAYVRFDTLSTEVRTLGGSGGTYGVPYDFPLGAPFGSSPEYDGCTTDVRGGYGMTVEIRDDAVVTSVKVVDLGNCEYRSTFAAGIGFVDYNALGGYLDLVYARVGGIEYGEPIAVAAEAAPDTIEPPAFEVYPNPARRSVTVLYETAVPGNVRLTATDALGRAVAVLEDGFKPAGHHEARLDVAGLVPGVYVLRLTTATGKRTQKLTVLR